MLNFLVKIATYLDDKEHYELAERVDALIKKLSQDVGRRGPLQRELPKEGLVQVLTDIVNKAWEQSYKPSQDAVQQASYMNQRLANALGSEEMPEALKPFINKVLANLNLIAGNADPNNKMTKAWSDIVDEGKAVLDTMQRATQSATTAPTKHKTQRPNALVMRIQNNLGVEATGFWSPETNDKFIEMMNSQPAYAKYMKGGKFQGNLQLAVRLTDALAELNKSEQQKPQQDMAAKAPPATQQQWHSKYFQLTPAAIKSLHEVEKYWPGTAQKELNDLDEYKEKGTMGKHMDQETFEEMLAGRAKPA